MESLRVSQNTERGLWEGWAGAVLKAARLLGVVSRAAAVTWDARPREGAWVGPEGGPLNCGAKSKVCGGQAGPGCLEPCDLPPRTAGQPGTLRKDGEGPGRGLEASAPQCRFGVPVGLPRKEGEQVGASGESKMDEGLSTPYPKEESGGHEDPGWSPAAVCAQKQGWGCGVVEGRLGNRETCRARRR